MAGQFGFKPEDLDGLTAREWHLLLAEAPSAVVAPRRPKPRTVAEFKAMRGGER